MTTIYRENTIPVKAPPWARLWGPHSWSSTAPASPSTGSRGSCSQCSCSSQTASTCKPQSQRDSSLTLSPCVCSCSTHQHRPPAYCPEGSGPCCHLHPNHCAYLPHRAVASVPHPRRSLPQKLLLCSKTCNKEFCEILPKIKLKPLNCSEPHFAHNSQTLHATATQHHPKDSS